MCFSTEPTIVCHFCRKKYKGLEEPRTIKSCKFYLLEMDLCIKKLAALKTKKAYYLLCNWTRLMSDPCAISLFFRCSVHCSCNVLLSYIKSCDHVSSFHSTDVQAFDSTTKFQTFTLFSTNDITDLKCRLVERRVQDQNFVILVYACRLVLWKELG